MWEKDRLHHVGYHRLAGWFHFVVVIAMANLYDWPMETDWRQVKLNLYLKHRIVCMFVSLLSHFWLIHFFLLFLLYQTYCRPLSSYMCSITPETAKVQLSAADSQTVPTVATGVSKPLCCRLTLTFTLTSENLSLYITLLLYWSSINYAAHVADILTPTTHGRTRCRQSQLRFVLSPLLLHLRLLIVPVGYSTFHIDLAS